MAETKSRRKLFKVAKELNLAHQTIIEFLEKKKYKVSGLNTPITDDIYQEILKRFSQEKVRAEKVARRRKERVKEEVIPAETLTASTAGEEAPTAPGEDVQQKETPEIPAKEVEEVPEISEEVSQEVPEVVEEAETAAPVEIEETVVEEEAEEAVEAGETEPEESEPQVGDIVDHPGAKQFLKYEEEQKKKKTEKKRKLLRKIKSDARDEKTSQTKEEEIVPRRIRAFEKENAMPEDLIAEETGVGKPDSSKKKKDKKRKDKKKKTSDEGLSEKERRRRKAFEMIRKDNRRGKTKMPVIDEAAEGETLEKGTRKKRSRKKKEVDQQAVDDTLKKTLASMQTAGTGRKKHKKIKENGEEIIEDENVIAVTEFITVQELSNLMDIPVADVIKKCLELGQMVSMNQRLDMDLIRLLAEDYGFRIEEEEEYASDFIEESFFNEEEEKEEDLKQRHPVVTVMGHVDHGKTSLLDYIRHANVVGDESGGITQHIGAYVFNLDDDRQITFLDTPGHEAFTAMRSRGAQATDIVVLVIAADDKVMPQTEEAIDHAQAAGVPIVIAINKIDKPGADPQAIRKQLADRNILVEDWGGKYQVVEVSAKTGAGIPDLLEKIWLESELLELKANPNKHASGVVIESRLDRGKGPVATVLVQRGTLKIGDNFIIGQFYGKVRALFNDRNLRIDSAGPSTPVQVLGIDGVPEAGDKCIVLPEEKIAREIASQRRQLKREQDFKQIRLLTLDEISRQIKEGQVKELNLLVKADVDGSVQALSDSLMKLGNEDVAVKVIRRAVGPISESDVMLAAASKAIILGFHIRPTLKAKNLAATENVDIRIYKIIYNAIEDVKMALEGMLEPEEREEVLGMAEVREVFKISRLGNIAGCYMLEGKINRNARVRLIRNDEEIYEGRLSSLKRFKEDTREVVAGYECGLMIENYNDIKVGDMIEAFEVVKEKRTLST